MIEEDKIESKGHSLEILADEPKGDEETFVQFRLLYSGRLLGASRSDTRARLKHEIRKKFSPQLKRLWDTKNTLHRISHENSQHWLAKHPEDSFTRSMPAEEVRAIWHDYGLRYIAHKWERSGQKLIPLVTEEMGVRCTIDILFLRPEEPGMIIQGGDLDNRIKTVFDALRIPKGLEEMDGKVQEEPIYCLLEDDRLISEFRVRSDSLLLLPEETVASPNDVFLVIDVRLSTRASSRWHPVFA